MQRARRRVHELGGLEATNSYHAFLPGAGGRQWIGIWCRPFPPELMLLPNWFAINIYEMSSWTRGIVIPLAILYAHKPRFSVPAEASVEELFRDPSRKRSCFGLGAKSSSAGAISFWLWIAG